MKNNIVIFGCGGQARLIYNYINDCKKNEVVSFIVSKGHKHHTTFCEKPVIELNESLPSDMKNKQFYVALSYQDMNKTRTYFYEYIKSLQLKPFSFIHTSSIIALTSQLEEHLCIFENVSIQHDTTIKENTIIYSNTSISHGSIIGKNCFIGQNVAICGDVTIGKNCFIGAGSVIHNNVSIGNNCLIGAHAVVSKSIPDNSSILPPHSTYQTDAQKRFSKWLQK